MSQGNLTYFTVDRFGNSNSSLALNGGWTQIPAGVYFDTPEFTISVWVYPQQVGSYSRVINFGNSSTSTASNIVLRFDSDSDKSPALNIINSAGSSIGVCFSSEPLLNAEWQFLAATFNGTFESIYINGNLTGSVNVSTYILPSTNRLNNYIGKSFSSYHGFSSSYLDDLRFYNKSLTQEEIIQLMNQNDSKGK